MAKILEMEGVGEIGKKEGTGEEREWKGGEGGTKQKFTTTLLLSSGEPYLF